MLQMMDEKLAISESKVRQLEAEKEALQIHLKLVLEELKNPIKIVKEDSPVPTPSKSRAETPNMIWEDEGFESDDAASEHVSKRGGWRRGTRVSIESMEDGAL
jgi:hypothetical protein